MNVFEQLKYDRDGLIPAIVQEESTGRVLMMAWMNQAALQATLASGQTHFWSRSRKKLWKKGETSGHVQKVKQLAIDCDGDTLLVQVEQQGAACHEGYKSCFYRTVTPPGQSLVVSEAQLFDPGKVYGAE